MLFNRRRSRDPAPTGRRASAARGDAREVEDVQLEIRRISTAAAPRAYSHRLRRARRAWHPCRTSSRPSAGRPSGVRGDLSLIPMINGTPIAGWCGARLGVAFARPSAEDPEFCHEEALRDEELIVAIPTRWLPDDGGAAVDRDLWQEPSIIPDSRVVTIPTSCSTAGDAQDHGGKAVVLAAYRAALSFVAIGEEVCNGAESMKLNALQRHPPESPAARHHGVGETTDRRAGRCIPKFVKVAPGRRPQTH